MPCFTPVRIAHTFAWFLLYFSITSRVAGNVLLRPRMKLVFLPLLAAMASFAQPVEPDTPASDVNVNSRYTVESIDFSNHRHYRLSSALLEEMQELIGQHLNTDALNRLAGRVASEVRAHSVTFKLARGLTPDHVKVLLDVDRRRGVFDISIPRFAYISKLGWTGAGEIGMTAGANKVSFGLKSDADSSVAREAGVQTKYERMAAGSDRIQLGFEFDSFHEQYSRATLAALDSTQASSLGAGAYRSRMNFEPSATFVLAKPLTLTVGFSFEQLEPQVTAARTESANAVINTLRYHRRWEGSDTNQQEFDAGYSLRAATRALGGNLAYTRHALTARYGYKHERQLVEVALVAGLIYGNSPLFERFVLGNSTTLRGWNKFDLDPLGGNRVVHGSVTYGYRIMRVFYDTGSVWDSGKTPEVKQSAGAGISTGLRLFRKDAFLLAIAFPIRQGRVEPVFIAGMNF